MTLGRTIGELRKQYGMSRAELGWCRGVTGACISQIESGKREPSMRLLRRLSEELQCELLIQLIHKGGK